MEELPKLPGNTFPDLTRFEFNVPHHFDWYNGYPIVKDPQIGIGKHPLDTESIAFAYDVDNVRLDPTMVYGRTKKYLPPVFKPHFVMYDKKCLSFKAFFTQFVQKECRIRRVLITYFLEDDTITILEPPTLNAGFPQGKLVRRGRYPRDATGQLLHWKDFNVGINLELNGISYHLYSCDNFTREFLISQGMIVNEEETCPKDPYTEKRRALLRPKTHLTSDVDVMKKFILFEGKVLRFKALWDDRGTEYAEKNQYNINYHLQDDCIEILEIRPPNSGKDGPTKLMSKMKVPKNIRAVQDNVPAYLEMSEEDVTLYLGPPDFIVGKTVNIFYRRFLLIDCDDYTRKYYETLLKIIQPDAITIEKVVEPKPIQPLPPYMGIGSPEDSIQSWYRIIPKPPKRDEVRLVVNMNKKLRYTAVLDWIHPEDKERRFVIEYRLTDGYIKISELRMDNSGHTGGGFLKSMLVPKHGSDPDNPEYLTPLDFVLGDVITVFGHRFIITGMDVAVYRYMEANPEKFSATSINEARRHLIREGLLTEDVKDVAEFRKREEIAEPVIIDDGTRIDGFSALEVPPKTHPLDKPECKVKFAENETFPVTLSNSS